MCGRRRAAAEHLVRGGILWVKVDRVPHDAPFTHIVSSRVAGIETDLIQLAKQPLADHVRLTQVRLILATDGHGRGGVENRQRDESFRRSFLIGGTHSDLEQAVVVQAEVYELLPGERQGFGMVAVCEQRRSGDFAERAVAVNVPSHRLGQLVGRAQRRDIDLDRERLTFGDRSDVADEADHRRCNDLYALETVVGQNAARRRFGDLQRTAGQRRRHG